MLLLPPHSAMESDVIMHSCFPPKILLPSVFACLQEVLACRICGMCSLN